MKDTKWASDLGLIWSLFVKIWCLVFDLKTIGVILLNHPLMANIWEKAISILAGNLNSGLSYLDTTEIGLSE